MKMVDLSSSVARKSDLLAYEMDGETVMLSVEQGTYYALDSIGGRIWELIENTTPVSSLIEKLQLEFKVDAEVCRNDTLSFLNELLAFGVIEVMHGSPA